MLLVLMVLVVLVLIGILENFEILILMDTQYLRAFDASLPIAMRIQIRSINL